MKDAVSTGPKWTQDEAINYECARDCITELIGIYSGAIASEEARASPDQGKISEILAVRSSLARERMALRVKDHERIAEVQSTYNARIRAYRVASQRQDV